MTDKWVTGSLTPEAVTSVTEPWKMLLSDLALELWSRELCGVGFPLDLPFQSFLSAQPLRTLLVVLLEPSAKFL